MIGADGTLVGYGGGLERRWLLDHEAVASGRRLAIGLSRPSGHQVESNVPGRATGGSSRTTGNVNA